MGHADSGRKHALVVRASFSALGGAERELLQLIPFLEDIWNVSLATLEFSDEARALFSSDTTNVFSSTTPLKAKNGLFHEVRNSTSKQAKRLWKTVKIPWQSIDVVHISVCRGSLEILPFIPHHIPIHYHCLEPPRWLYEDVLHKDIFGRLKRPAFLTNLALRKQKKDDQKFVEQLKKRNSTTISGNSFFTSNRLTNIYKFNQPSTTTNGQPPQRNDNGQPQQATFLHHAIDLQQWPVEPSTDEISAVNQLKLPSKYVVTVGKISHVKGTVETITSLQHTGIALIHIGGGSPQEKEHLMNHASQLGVEVRCMPRLTQTEICGIVRGAVAMVSHAHGEPFGLTPIEALSIGIPPVVVDVGGFSETMSGIDGSFLFQRSESDNMLSLLERAQREEVRLDCYQRGRPYVESHFSFQHEAKMLTQLLEELLTTS